MQELIHADIFFFVTTIVVGVLGIFLIIAGVYGVLILNDLKYISKKLKKGSDEIMEDFEALRSEIKEKGSALKHAKSFFRIFFGGRRSKD